MITVGDLLTTGVVPLVVALAIVVGGRAMRLRPAVVWPVALALAYVAAFVSHQAMSKGPTAWRVLFDARMAQDWLAWFAVAAAAAAVIGASHSWRWPVVPLLALAVAGAFPARSLWTSVYVTSEWSMGEAAIWLSSLAAALWLVWMLFHTSPESSQPRLRLVLVFIVTMATSVVLAMSGVLVYGLLAGAVAAGLVGMSAWPIWRRDASEELSAGLASGGGVLTMLVGGLTMLGYFFAELTATNAVLLGVALAAAAVKLPGAIDARPKVAICVRLGACLVPLAVAVTLAARAFVAAMAEQAADAYW